MAAVEESADVVQFKEAIKEMEAYADELRQKEISDAVELE